MTQVPKYRSPVAVKTALKQRARTAALGSAHIPHELERQYYFHRLLARVAAHDQTGWVLKGGQALLVRYRHGRASRDIDLYNSQAQSLDQAVAALLAAAELDLGDFFQFQFIDRRDREDDQAAEGTKVRFRPLLGAEPMLPFGVDVVVGLLPTQVPEIRAIVPEVKIDWPAADEPPQLPIYPLVDHLADKICAMYERHRSEPSSRHRDLVDIMIMATEEDVLAAEATGAVVSEYARRQHSGRVELALPDQFEVPGPRWPAGYEAEAKKVPALGDLRAFREAAQLADTFLSPILAGSRTGHWRHLARAWQ